MERAVYKAVENNESGTGTKLKTFSTKIFGTSKLKSSRLRMHLNGCISLFSAVSLLIIISGCSKQQAGPTPPKVRSQLVQELFEALDAGDHSKATAKIKRLRELDPGNVFLANLEIVERNNIIINEIQKDLNGGDLKGAMERIEKALASFGTQDDLKAASTELNTLKQIDDILGILEGESSDAVTFARNAGTLKSIAAAYKPAEIFIPTADSKLALSKIMARWERQRSREDLASDYLKARAEKNSLSSVILASISIENPEAPEVKSFLAGISRIKSENK